MAAQPESSSPTPPHFDETAHLAQLEKALNLPARTPVFAPPEDLRAVHLAPRDEEAGFKNFLVPTLLGAGMIVFLFGILIWKSWDMLGTPSIPTLPQRAAM